MLMQNTKVQIEVLDVLWAALVAFLFHRRHQRILESVLQTAERILLVQRTRLPYVRPEIVNVFNDLLVGFRLRTFRLECLALPRLPPLHFTRRRSSKNENLLVRAFPFSFHLLLRLCLLIWRFRSHGLLFVWVLRVLLHGLPLFLRGFVP